MNEERRKVRPLGLILAFTTSSSLVATFPAWMLLFEPRPNLDARNTEELFGWILFAMFACFACRAPFLGVRRRGDSLIVDSWWRRRQIPINSIKKISSEDYIGTLVRTNFRGWLQMLAIRTNVGSMSFPAISSGHARMQRMAAQIGRMCS